MKNVFVLSAVFLAIATTGVSIASAETANKPASLEDCLALLNGMSPQIAAAKLSKEQLSAISPKGEAMAKQCMRKDFDAAFQTYSDISAALKSVSK